MPRTRTTVVLGAGGRQLWCLTLHSCGGLTTGPGLRAGAPAVCPKDYYKSGLCSPAECVLTAGEAQGAQPVSSQSLRIELLVWGGGPCGAPHRAHGRTGSLPLLTATGSLFGCPACMQHFQVQEAALLRGLAITFSHVPSPPTVLSR